MWKRFVDVVRCLKCKGPLDLRSFRSERVQLTPTQLERAARRGIAREDFDVYIDSGVLLCKVCKLKFPIVEGLPVLLPYITPLHLQFAEQWKEELVGLEDWFHFSNNKPVLGEEFVLESFSKEWLDYDYDGVIWELSYQAHKDRILLEIGPALESAKWSLEVGCGLGLATNTVQETAECDAVGVDLSLAALKAARQFRTDPFLHFVQASAFALPLRQNFFDVIYSRGVLHHTYSTEQAFRKVAAHCRVGGTFYVWLYGPGSIRSNPLRLALYGLERLARPLLSRAPDSFPSRVFLGSLALGYITFNRIRRFANPDIQRLTYGRGIHAARDRFTPRFAHRHPAEQVAAWFKQCGYEDTKILDWREMPPAEREDFRRNVGIRAVRTAVSTN